VQSLAAVSASYDTVAVSYAELVPPISADPLDRALFTAFADLVGETGDGPVVELGCGTGRVTAHLSGLGLAASGIDLSPGMLAVARRTYPGLRFTEGSMLSVDLPAASLAAVVSWYSVIHLSPDQLPTAIAEFHRVLRPGGLLLLAFHVGDECLHRTEGYGHAGISLDVYRLPVDRVATLLTDAGFRIETELVRDPAARVPQARIVARRPVDDRPPPPRLL
jgi:ubiquinone/menaquinone biosynthesis C-methylase UbiE